MPSKKKLKVQSLGNYASQYASAANWAKQMGEYSKAQSYAAMAKAEMDRAAQLGSLQVISQQQQQVKSYQADSYGNYPQYYNPQQAIDPQAIRWSQNGLIPPQMAQAFITPEEFRETVQQAYVEPPTPREVLGKITGLLGYINQLRTG